MSVKWIVIDTLETIPKGLVKGLEDLEIKDYGIIKIGKNTEKNPRI